MDISEVKKQWIYRGAKDGPLCTSVLKEQKTYWICWNGDFSSWHGTVDESCGVDLVTKYSMDKNDL